MMDIDVKSVEIFHKEPHDANYNEDFSDTCSGGTCGGDCDETIDTSSGDGDRDDIISLCSWTTDQGEWSPSDPPCTTSEAPAESMMCYLPVAMAPDGAMSGISMTDAMVNGMTVALPQDMGGWYTTTMVPMPAMCYVVMQGDSTETGSVAPLGHWQEADYWTSAQWQRQQQKQRAGAQYAPGTWSNGAKHLRSAKKAAKSKKNCNTSMMSHTEDPTTLIFRELPLECSRDILLQILDDEGFSGSYDFVHMPIDFQTRVGLGYAIVNMVSHAEALRAQEKFTGFNDWRFPCENICEVAWNSTHQGLAVHIDRYRNSPLFHESVSETYHPVLFENGFRVKFPAPTARIRPPRIRHQKAGTPQE
jgi:hypothetical protein